MGEGIDLVESLVHWPAELDANVPSATKVLAHVVYDRGKENERSVPELLKRLRLAQSHEQEGVHKLSTADIVNVRLVRLLSLDTRTQRIKRYVPQMFRIVVFARNESLQSPGQPVDGRVVRRVILVGKYNVEVAIELGGGKVVKVFGDEGQANQISLGALQSDRQVSKL